MWEYFLFALTSRFYSINILQRHNTTKKKPWVGIQNIFVIINVKCSIHSGHFMCNNNGKYKTLFLHRFDVTFGSIYFRSILYILFHIKMNGFRFGSVKKKLSLYFIETEGRKCVNGRNFVNDEPKQNIDRRTRSFPKYFIYFHRIGFMIKEIICRMKQPCDKWVQKSKKKKTRNGIVTISEVKWNTKWCVENVRLSFKLPFSVLLFR